METTLASSAFDEEEPSFDSSTTVFGIPVPSTPRKFAQDDLLRFYGYRVERPPLHHEGWSDGQPAELTLRLHKAVNLPRTHLRSGSDSCDSFVRVHLIFAETAASVVWESRIVEDSQMPTFSQSARLDVGRLDEASLARTVMLVEIVAARGVDALGRQNTIAAGIVDGAAVQKSWAARRMEHLWLRLYPLEKSRFCWRGPRHADLRLSLCVRPKSHKLSQASASMGSSADSDASAATCQADAPARGSRPERAGPAPDPASREESGEPRPTAPSPSPAPRPRPRSASPFDAERRQWARSRSASPSPQCALSPSSLSGISPRPTCASLSRITAAVKGKKVEMDGWSDARGSTSGGGGGGGAEEEPRRDDFMAGFAELFTPAELPKGKPAPTAAFGGSATLGGLRFRHADVPYARYMRHHY